MASLLCPIHLFPFVSHWNSLLPPRLDSSSPYSYSSSLSHLVSFVSRHPSLKVYQLLHCPLHCFLVLGKGFMAQGLRGSKAGFGGEGELSPGQSVLVLKAPKLLLVLNLMHLHCVLNHKVASAF